MKLNLQKPLVIFDLETTGLDFVKDRVIQLSYIKVMPNGEERRENLTINPLIPIPQFITELTGISDADVADKPSFKDLAPKSLRDATLQATIPITSTFPCYARNSLGQASTSTSVSVA